MRRLSADPVLFLAAALLATLAGRVEARDDLGDLGPDDRATLRRYARDTWRSFEVMVHPVGLPVDRLRRDGDGAWTPSEKTSPTDIAAYLWSTLAAEELRLIEPDEAHRRLDRTLATLAKAERSHGFLFNWLDPRTGATLTAWPEDGTPVHPYLSAVDNGWLAAALVMVRNARPALRERAEALLEPMDFGFFYDAYKPADPIGHPGQLLSGYRSETKTFTVPYGMLNTEPRIASYIGIARGQLPPEHYYRMYRTWRPERGPQRQVPQGEVRTYRGVEVFEGHYTYRGLRVVPSWGGSMFEALMVPLFVPEERWGPKSWGVNHPLYVQVQIEHGLREARYGYWGFSPACIPEGGYRAYGVDAIGTDPAGFTSNNRGQKSSQGRAMVTFTDGVVPPHASFLALRYAPRAALENLKKLADSFPIYGPHGFHDSVNVTTGRVSDSVLALDQGMIMAAISNALVDDTLRHAFSDGPIEAAIRPLIAPEEFTAGRSPPPTDTASDGSQPSGPKR